MTFPSDQAAAAATAYRGVLLAAGRGTRFDPAGLDNKLLASLPASEEVVVIAAARSLLAVLPVVAVVGANAVDLRRRLIAIGCEVVECAQAGQGMSASLMCGVRHAQQAAGWIIALGDMPFVQSSTHRGLLAALHADGDIAVPVYQGQRGNPVAFGRRHYDRLMQLDGDRGARQLLQAFPATQVPVDDPGIVRDIDTRADLGRSS